MTMKLLPPEILSFVQDGREFQIQCEIDDLCVVRDAIEWEESDKLYQARIFLEEDGLTLKELEEIERAGKARVRELQEQIEKLKRLL